jgi:predicted SnoaL-like aldol condensation-catalyzing enzyme
LFKNIKLRVQNTRIVEEATATDAVDMTHQALPTVFTFTLTSLALSAGCTSSPGQLDTTSSTSKSTVVAGLDALFGRHDLTAVDTYFAEPYLQHNPSVASGLAPLRQLASPPQLQVERYRVFAEGDLVATHARYAGFGPSPLVAFDFFRVDGGKIVEHWDSMQVEAAATPSGHTMTDGQTSPGTEAHTAESHDLVADFIDTVLIHGHGDQLGTYLAGDQYIQHNPQVADGVSGLSTFLGDLARQGITMRYLKVHRIVAEGDMVVAQSEGLIGTQVYNFIDLFRVANGKITEHWDAVSQVPATTASGLGVF